MGEAAAAWTLALWIAWPGSGNQMIRLDYETRDDCMAALAASKIPQSQHAAENEWTGILVCYPTAMGFRYDYRVEEAHGERDGE